MAVKGHAQKAVALRQMGFKDGFRLGQEAVVNRIMTGKDVICILATGGGKCLAKDTPVIMYDGSIKLSQDIKVGDLLLGPDSLPRKVKALALGRQEMFRITPNQGDPYVVNRDHTLSLKITGMGLGRRVTCDERKLRAGDIIDISVGGYLRQSKNFKRCAKGWMPDAVQFSPQGETHPDLPPRILGVWLGDGGYDRTTVSKPDPEILMMLQHYADAIGATLSTAGSDSGLSHHLGFPETSNGCKGGSNRFRNALREVGVWENKHIPDAYLKAPYSARMELLAGLLDTDGHLQFGAKGYEITLKQEALVAQIVFLARSLGFRAAYSEKPVKLAGWDVARVYYRAHISGKLYLIPCRIPRKIAPVRTRQKDVTLTGIKVESLGEGDYYGFELEDGPDRRFLLGDFTVTHNSACFVIPSLCLDWPTLIFSPLQALMRDQVQSLQEKGIRAGRVSADQSDTLNAKTLELWMRGECQFMFVAPERMHNPEFQHALKIRPFVHMVVDEAHCLSTWSLTFRESYRFLGDFVRTYNPFVISAFTATLPPFAEAEVREVDRKSVV